MDFAILHVGITDISALHRTLIIHLLLAAKFIIIRHWKQFIPPTLQAVIADINYQCYMERALAFHRQVLPKFN